MTENIIAEKIRWKRATIERLDSQITGQTIKIAKGQAIIVKNTASIQKKLEQIKRLERKLLKTKENK